MYRKVKYVYKYWKYNISRCSKYTFIPENFYLMNLNMLACLMWDFEQLDMKTPPNLDDYRQLKTLMDIVQEFIPV